MKMLATALALALATAAGSTALADTPAPAAATAPYSIETTPIGTLIDTPATKAILDAELPGLTSHPNIAVAREMTLRVVQPYAADVLTEERLTKVEAAFAALNAKK